MSGFKPILDTNSSSSGFKPIQDEVINSSIKSSISSSLGSSGFKPISDNEPVQTVKTQEVAAGQTRDVPKILRKQLRQTPVTPNIGVSDVVREVPGVIKRGAVNVFDKAISGIRGVLDAVGRVEARNDAVALNAVNKLRADQGKTPFASAQEMDESSPIYKIINSPKVQRIFTTVADKTSNLGIKGLAALKGGFETSVTNLKKGKLDANKILSGMTNPATIPALIMDSSSEENYKKYYDRLQKDRNDPNNSFALKTLYDLQDSAPQSAIGALLYIAGSSVGAGAVLSAPYFGAISAAGQIKEKGKVNSLTNIGIDVVGDQILGGTLESIFKRPAKTIVGAFVKGFGTEGGTEVAQTLLKYGNDYKNARTIEDKAQVIKQAKEYVRNGGLLSEFLVGGIAGGGLSAGTAGIADNNIVPGTRIDAQGTQQLSTTEQVVMPQSEQPVSTSAFKPIVENSPTTNEVATPNVEPTIASTNAPTNIQTQTVTPQVAGKDTNVPTNTAIEAEAKKYKTAEEFVSAQNTRFHQTSPDIASKIESEGFRTDVMGSGNSDVLPIGVNTKTTDSELSIKAKGAQMEVYFPKGSNIKTFETRDGAEGYFYSHPDGDKYYKAIEEIKAIDKRYQSMFDELSREYSELAKTNPGRDVMSKELEKQSALLDEWTEKSLVQSKIAQSEATRIAKKEGWDAIQIDRDTGSFNRVTDNTIIINPEILKTKSQLTEIWNKANTPKVKVTPVVPKNTAVLNEKTIKRTTVEQTSQKPVVPNKSPKTDVKESTAYKKAKERLEMQYQEDITYTPIKISDQMAKAFELLESNPDYAKAIALGIEQPPLDITDTAISLAVAEDAKVKGDHQLQADAEKARSLRQTRRGQEIVMERGRVNENSPEFFIRELIQRRKELIQKKYKPLFGKMVSFTEMIDTKIKESKEKATKKLKSELEIKGEEIDAFLAEFAC